jgi:hypothetical protein
VLAQAGEDAVDVLLHVVEMERDPQIRVTRRRDDPLAGKCVHQRDRVGRDDADQRAVVALAAGSRDLGPELVETGQEPVSDTPASAITCIPATPG